MSITDYMKQGNNGQVNILIDKLPSKGFIDAIKVRELCKARILHGNERVGIKSGSPDVKLVSVTGETHMITRAQLAKNYRLPNNKKIVIAFLKNNTNYVVTRYCQDNYKILKLPDNCIGNFKGHQVESGSYLVCKQDEQGNMDMNTLNVVSPYIFKKMFKVPMQPIIKKHMQGNGNKIFGLFNNKTDKNSRPNGISRASFGLHNEVPSKNYNEIKPNKIDSSELGLNPRDFNVVSLNNRIKQQESKYKFRVINNVMSMQNPKQQIGFTVQEIATGKIRQCGINQVVQLCNQKLVENVKLVQTERGTKYLAGVGVVLKNLPQVLQ